MFFKLNFKALLSCGNEGGKVLTLVHLQSCTWLKLEEIFEPGSKEKIIMNLIQAKNAQFTVLETW